MNELKILIELVHDQLSSTIEGNVVGLVLKSDKSFVLIQANISLMALDLKNYWPLSISLSHGDESFYKIYMQGDNKERARFQADLIEYISKYAFSSIETIINNGEEIITTVLNDSAKNLANLLSGGKSTVTKPNNVNIYNYSNYTRTNNVGFNTKPEVVTITRENPIADFLLKDMYEKVICL